jgi:hypothetical protein
MGIRSSKARRIQSAQVNIIIVLLSVIATALTLSVAFPTIGSEPNSTNITVEMPFPIAWDPSTPLSLSLTRNCLSSKFAFEQGKYEANECVHIPKEPYDTCFQDLIGPIEEQIHSDRPKTTIFLVSAGHDPTPIKHRGESQPSCLNSNSALASCRTQNLTKLLMQVGNNRAVLGIPDVLAHSLCNGAQTRPDDSSENSRLDQFRRPVLITIDLDLS